MARRRLERLETVLTERPCRVVIESTPDGTGARAKRRVGMEKASLEP